MLFLQGSSWPSERPTEPSRDIKFVGKCDTGIEQVAWHQHIAFSKPKSVGRKLPAPGTTTLEPTGKRRNDAGLPLRNRVEARMHREATPGSGKSRGISILPSASRKVSGGSCPRQGRRHKSLLERGGTMLACRCATRSKHELGHSSARSLKSPIEGQGTLSLRQSDHVAVPGVGQRYRRLGRGVLGRVLQAYTLASYNASAVSRTARGDERASYTQPCTPVPSCCSVTSAPLLKRTPS